MGVPFVTDYAAVLEMKQAVARRFSVNVHFHDGCGGQYFSLDEPNDELTAYITAYYAERGLCAVLSEDGLSFTLEKGTSC